MRSRTIEVKRAKAGDFQRNRLNPKTHDTTQLDILGELLDKFGVVGGIIVYRSERNNNEWTLFDGHGRQELNPDVEYDVTYTDLTDQDVDKLSMMYDRIAARATPDAEIEAELLKDIDLSGYPELIAFARDIIIEDDIDIDMAALAGFGDLGDEGDGDGSEGNDAPPQIDKAKELQAKWQVKMGDIYKLGESYIGCCDSSIEKNINAILNLASIKKIDMLWGDAPYGMNLNADFRGISGNEKMNKDKGVSGGNYYSNVIGDEKDFDPRLLMDTFSSTKEQFWWGADYYAERIPDKNNGSWFVWDKRLDETMDKVYGSTFELCWSKTKHKRDMARIKWSGLFGTENEPGRKRYHPTQKPTILFQWFLERYLKEGGVIFDPFVGAGCSIIGAYQYQEKTGFEYQVLGFEIHPPYVAVTIQRFLDATGIQPTLIKNIYE